MTTDHISQMSDHDQTPFKTMLIEIGATLLHSVQKATIKSSLEDTLCYCQRDSKKSEIIECSLCKSRFHLSCVNCPEEGWLCAKCQSCPVKLLKTLKEFYVQYQSDYCDFSEAFGYTNFQIKLLSKKESPKDIFSKEAKTWLHRDITFSSDYAQAILLRVTDICDLRDLFTVLKEILIFVACKSKLATLRSKALKAIKATIKLQPTLLLDQGIQQVISHRISDQSSIAREAAIDLLLTFFSEKQDYDKFIKVYLPLILQRSSDKS